MKSDTIKTIEVTVAIDGRTQVETKGFVGNSCQAASRFLREALGLCVAEQLSHEFHSCASSPLHLPQRSSSE
jgi:hypothetical protein